MSKFSDKAAEYGRIGSYLLDIVKRERLDGFLAEQSEIIAQIVAFSRSRTALAQVHPLAQLAFSLLCLPFPVQTDMPPNLILLLLQEGLGISNSYLREVTGLDPDIRSLLQVSRKLPHARLLRKLYTDASRLERVTSALFPKKKHPGATSKINVVLPALIRSIGAVHGYQIVAHMLYRGAFLLTEDQMCSALIYGAGLITHFGDLGWSIAMYLLLNVDDAKGLSNVIKASGANSTPVGCVLAEANTLQGRGIGSLNLQEAARERTTSDYMRKNLVNIDPEAIRPHIHSLIAAELRGRKLEIPDLNDFWSSRWGWCVNGSETSTSDRALGIDLSYLKDSHSRLYRRVAAENLEREPISSWDGTTYVSASEKLEHGKTRAIFACDTRSYFAFSWVLNSVQKAWRNERILLDPGSGGHLGIVSRVLKAQRGGGVNLMLDFDDFNSHHPNEIMQVVFDELCVITGMPDWYREVLNSSFDKTYIKVGNVWRRVLGSLMSGHRGTTFINSVLNAAYLRYAIGAHSFDKLISLHTGDDIYIRAPTLADCGRILELTRAVGCRMNPSKQSIGFRGAEFLRMGIRGNHAYGYFARGVAGFVGGNWTTLDPMGPYEGLRTCIASARSLINRSGTPALSRILGPCIRYNKFLGVRTTIKLLAGEVAFAGGPVFNTDYYLRTYEVSVPQVERPEMISKWRTFATRDYLTDHISPVEAEVLREANIDVGPLLVISSYSKGLNQGVTTDFSQLKIRRRPARIARGQASAVDLLQTPSEKGCLSKYPIINFVKDYLNSETLRHLVKMEGGDHLADNIREVAFGLDSHTVNIIGTLSYADAASLSTKTRCDNIITTIHTHV